MRRSILSLFLLLTAVCSACYYGMGTREKVLTPEEFLNNSRISSADYSEDSTELLLELKKMLNNHEASFHSKEYDDATVLIIDTIIYNENFDRLGVFVISKNPTYKQLAPDSNHSWYYDATCYLGLKQQDTISLSWLGPNFTNSSDQKTLSAMFRDACFTAFANTDTTNGGLYRYNLNDKRFWEGPLWQKKFPYLNR